MHTLLAHAARTGWEITPPRALTVPGGEPLTFVGFILGGTQIYTYWNTDNTLHDAQIYRGHEFEPFLTTSDQGVALGWLTAHGTEVAA